MGSIYLESFVAVDNLNQRHIIDVYQDVLPAPRLDDPNAVMLGRKSLITRAGRSVNRVEKGVYQLVYNQQIIRSNDVNAI